MASSPAINPPVVTVVEIDDPTVAGADIELLDLDAVQLESMPLRVRRIMVRFDAGAVVYHSTNVPIRTRTRVRDGHYAFDAPGPLAHGIVNGVTVDPSVLFAAEPGAEARFVVEAGWESVAFVLRVRELEEHLESRKRHGDFQRPRGVEAFRTSREKVRALFDWGKRLVDTAARDPIAFGRDPKLLAGAQVELVESVLATLDTATDADLPHVDRTRQAHSLVVKLAEDFALSRVDQPLYVTDLCRAAQVSERTLEYAFKRVLGSTPTRYLTRLRLHRARQSLLAASQGTTTVTAEALKWGFWHFGEFSRAYRECFGELPSETLRRPAHERKGPL